MAEILCGYTADRDDTLMAYLYGEIEPEPRAAFEAHLATCERCRRELGDLQDVRGHLRGWRIPDAKRPIVDRASLAQDLSSDAGTLAPDGRTGIRTILRNMPAWAQVAAALVFVGVAAGVANLDVRYEQGGLSVRTGWSRTAAPSVTSGRRPASLAGVETSVPIQNESVGSPTVPWRADLERLERRLRTEFRGGTSTQAATSTATAAAELDVQFLRRVRALIDESERRQQNELALRIAEVVREFDAKRGADLVNIDRSLRAIQSNTGVEVLRQREALSRLDYLVRTSGQAAGQR
jgi:anti-sigma factor RsiW